MRLRRPLATSVLVVLSIVLSATLTHGESPSVCRIDNVPRIKQLHNYCGPAALTSVMLHYGETTTQEEIGKCVFDPVGSATNGADMLLYARDKGYASYSWNSSIADAKKKLAAGVPVLVLQQNSYQDTSGHFRVLTGYDESASKFYVMDPYYDEITELTYEKCDKLWKSMGYWAMIVVPTDKDTFCKELSDKNPVVHMDLSSAMFKQGKYTDALKEIKTALSMEPGNNYAKSILQKINHAIGAGKKG